VAKLRSEGIVAAPRAGWVRTSPHFYISPPEIDRLVDSLP
jgi:selenocysteine lyase/cysteine desulfurase